MRTLIAAGIVAMVSLPGFAQEEVPSLDVCIQYAEADVAYADARRASNTAYAAARDAANAVYSAATRETFAARKAARDAAVAAGRFVGGLPGTNILREAGAAFDAAMGEADAAREAAMHEARVSHEAAYHAIYAADSGHRKAVPEIMAKLRERHRILCRTVQRM